MLQVCAEPGGAEIHIFQHEFFKAREGRGAGIWWKAGASTRFCSPGGGEQRGSLSRANPSAFLHHQEFRKGFLAKTLVHLLPVFQAPLTWPCSPAIISKKPHLFSCSLGGQGELIRAANCWKPLVALHELEASSCAPGCCWRSFLSWVQYPEGATPSRNGKSIGGEGLKVLLGVMQWSSPQNPKSLCRGSGKGRERKVSAFLGAGPAAWGTQGGGLNP